MSIKNRLIASVAAMTITATSLGYTGNLNLGLGLVGKDTKNYGIINTVTAVAADRERTYAADAWDNNYYNHSFEVLRIELPSGGSQSYAGCDFVDLARLTVTHKTKLEDGVWFETDEDVVDVEDYYVWIVTDNPSSTGGMSGVIDTRTTLDLTKNQFIGLPTSVDIQDGEDMKTVKVNGSTVTGIGGHLTSTMPYLKEITLNNNIKYILPEAFEGLQYITDIELPAGLISLGAGAFANSGLKSIKINSKMPLIPASCFSNTKLSDITLAYPKDVEVIGSGAFSGTVLTSIPIGETSSPLVIGSDAFSGCTQLSTITLPNSTAVVGNGAFTGCSAAKSVSTGTNTYIIGSGAFSDMGALKQITLNSKLTWMGSNVFANNTSLVTGPELPDTLNMPNEETGYDVPESLIPDLTTRRRVIDFVGESISTTGTFSGDSVLKTVKLPSKLTAIPSGTFEDCVSLTLPSVGSNITTVHASAFANCKNLQELKIAENATAVYAGAFSGCTSLRELSFKTIDCLDDNAYSGCNTLKSVDITVGEYIRNGCFSDCTGLKTVSVKTKGASFIWGSSIFSGCTQLETAYLDLENANFIPCGIFAGDIRLTSLGDTVLKNIEIVSEGAFAGCSSLESLALPKVVIVEDSAFSDCTKLKTICSGDITIKDYGANSFTNCKALTQKINANVSTIGANAFTNSAITAVKITGTDGNTLVIDDGAFTQCEGLTTVEINIPDGVEYKIGNGIFSGDTNIKSATYNGTEVPESMFSGCTKLTTLSLPRAVDILDKAFEGCTQLTTISDAKAFGSIHEQAFAGCSSLQKTYADKSTTFYGNGQYLNCEGIKTADVYYLTDSMFEGCTELEKVNLASNVTIIPEKAFLGCSKLATINLDSVKDFRSNSFTGTGLESLKLSSANSIASEAFSECQKLRTVDIEIDDIGEAAFANCPSLYKADLTVNRLENNVFNGCYSMYDMTFVTGNGYSLIEVGDGAFEGTLLDHVVIPSTVTYIGSNAFGYGPDGKRENYTVYGTPGSEAETYANANEFEFKDVKTYNKAAILKQRTKLGDVNMDGIISIADAVKLQQWLLGNPSGSVGIYGPNMDLTQDGRVDAFDMILMRRKLIESMGLDNPENIVEE